MDNSTHNDDILVRYMDGELPEAEKSSLKNSLANDKLLQEQYESLLLTREAIRQYGLKIKVGEIHQQMMHELQQPVKKINPARKLYRITAAVAAGIIFLIAGFWVYNFYSLSGEKLYSANYKSYELSNVRDANSTLTDVEKAYSGKDYQEVIRIHDMAAERSVKTEFLCGVAAMELNNNTKAITCFKEVLQLNSASNSDILKDESEYYLSLSYLRNGDYDFSLELLDKIRNDKEHTYNAAVTKKLIRQVKMLKWR
jgi:tetratricopeptide (TPR) repeat protein